MVRDWTARNGHRPTPRRKGALGFSCRILALALLCVFGVVADLEAQMEEVSPGVFCSYSATGEQTHCVDLRLPSARTMGAPTVEEDKPAPPPAAAPPVAAPPAPKPTVKTPPAEPTPAEPPTAKTEETATPKAATEKEDAAPPSSAPAVKKEPAAQALTQSREDAERKKRAREAEQRLIHQKGKEALQHSRDRVRQRPGYQSVEPITGETTTTPQPSGPNYDAINNTAKAVGRIINKGGDNTAPPQEDAPFCVAGDIAAALQRDLDKNREEIDKQLWSREQRLAQEREKAEKEKKKVEKDKQLDKKVKGRKQAKREKKKLNDKRDKLGKDRDKLLEENDNLEADKERIEKERKDLNKKMQEARRGDPNCRGPACRKIRGQLEENSRQRVNNIKQTGKFQQKWERQRRAERNFAREEAKFEKKLDKGFGQTKEQWKARMLRKKAAVYRKEFTRLTSRRDALKKKSPRSSAESRELRDLKRAVDGLTKKFGSPTGGLGSKFDQQASEIEEKLAGDGTTSIDEALELDADKINKRVKALDSAAQDMRRTRESLRDPSTAPDPKKTEKAIRDHEKAQKDVDRLQKEFDKALKKQPTRHPPVDPEDIKKATAELEKLQKNGASYREVQEARQEVENLTRADARHRREAARNENRVRESIGKQLDAAHESEANLRGRADAARAQKFVDGYNREIRDITGKDGKIDVAKVDAKARRIDRSLDGISGANAEIGKLNGIRRNLIPGEGGAPSAAERLGLSKKIVKGRLVTVNKKLASAMRERNRHSRALTKAGFKNTVKSGEQCVVTAATTPFAWAYVQGSRAAAQGKETGRGKRQVASTPPARSSGTASPAAGQRAKNASQAQMAKQAEQAKQAQQYKAPGCSAGAPAPTACTRSQNTLNLAALDTIFGGETAAKAKEAKPAPVASAPLELIPAWQRDLAAGVIGGAGAAALKQAALEDRLQAAARAVKERRKAAKQVGSAARQTQREANKAKEDAKNARVRAQEERQGATQRQPSTGKLTEEYTKLAVSAAKRVRELRAKAKALRDKAARNRTAAARYEKSAESEKDKSTVSAARQAAVRNTEDATRRERQAAAYERDAKKEEARAREYGAKSTGFEGRQASLDKRAQDAEADAARLAAAAGRKQAEADRLEAERKKRDAALKAAEKTLEAVQAEKFADLLKNTPSADFYSRLDPEKRPEWLRRNVAGWDRLSVAQKVRILSTLDYAEARRAALDVAARVDAYIKTRGITPEGLQRRAEEIAALKKRVKEIKSQKILTNSDLEKIKTLEKRIVTETASLDRQVKTLFGLRKLLSTATLEAQRRLWAVEKDERRKEVERRVGAFATAKGQLQLAQAAAKAREAAFAARKREIQRRIRSLTQLGDANGAKEQKKQLKRLEEARKVWLKHDTGTVEKLKAGVRDLRQMIASQSAIDRLGSISFEDDLVEAANAYLLKKGGIAKQRAAQAARIREAVFGLDIKGPAFSASEAVSKSFSRFTTDRAAEAGSGLGLLIGTAKGVAGFLKVFVWEPIDLWGEQKEKDMLWMGFRFNFFGSENHEFLEAFGKDPGKMVKKLFFGLGKKAYTFSQDVQKLGKAKQESDAAAAFKSSFKASEFVGEIFVDPTLLVFGVAKVVGVVRAGGEAAAGLRAADKLLDTAPSARAVEEAAKAVGKIDPPPPLPDTIGIPVARAPPPVRETPILGKPVGGKTGVARQIFCENCGLVALEALLKDLGIVVGERLQRIMRDFALSRGLMTAGEGMTVFQLREYLRLTGILPKRTRAGFFEWRQMRHSLQKGRDVVANIQNGAGGYHWVRVEKIAPDASGKMWVSFGEGGLPKGLSKRISLKEFDRITRVYPGQAEAGRRLRSLVIDSPSITTAERLKASILAADNVLKAQRALPPTKPIAAAPLEPRPLPDLSSAPGNLAPPARARPTIEQPKARPTIERPKAAGPVAGGNASTPAPVRRGPGDTPVLKKPKTAQSSPEPQGKGAAPSTRESAAPKVTVEMRPFDITLTMPNGKKITLALGKELGSGSFTTVSRIDDPRFKGLIIKITEGGEKQFAVLLDKAGYDFLASLPEGVKKFIVRTPEIVREFKVAAANDNALVNGSIRVAQEAPPTFWDVTRGSRRMTAAEAETFHKAQRTINDGGAVWLDNKANNYGFELGSGGRVRLVVHDTGGIVPMKGNAERAAARARVFQRAVSNPPPKWLATYHDAGKAALDSLNAWRAAQALPPGTPGRAAQINNAEAAYRAWLDVKIDIPLQYRQKLLNTYGKWIDTDRLGVPLHEVAFNPVNGFEYFKPRHLIANDNTAARLQKALKIVHAMDGK